MSNTWYVSLCLRHFQYCHTFLKPWICGQYTPIGYVKGNAMPVGGWELLVFFSILFGVHYTALFTASAFTLHNYWRIPKRCSDAVTAPIQEKYTHTHTTHAYAQFEWEKLLQSKNSVNEKYTRYFCFCQVFPSCHSLHIFLACLWLLEIEVKKIILKRSVKSTLDHFKKSGAQLESVNCIFIFTWAHHKAVHLLVANCNRHHDDQFKLTADTTPHITSIDST